MKSLMKHILIIVVVINSISGVYVYGQERLIEAIHNSYHLLDTIHYIINIKSTVHKDIEKLWEEWEPKALELDTLNCNRTFVDSDKSTHCLDSLANARKVRSEKAIKESYNEFVSRFNHSRKVEFVLNLHITTDTINGDIRYSLQPDTGKFPFNVYFFGKYLPPTYAVVVRDGEYLIYSPLASTTREMADNRLKAYRKIMKKKPKYLLYSDELNRMGAIPYVLNDKIYVYRVIQQEEYELSDYIERFGLIR